MMTMIAYRRVGSVGRDKIPPTTGVEVQRMRGKAISAMNSLKPLLANLKSLALIVLLAALILASGFLALKTLLLTETPIEGSGGLRVNASSDNSRVKVNSGYEGVNSGDPSVSSASPNVTSGSPSVTVWVNTSSGVYHCPNTRWYGNTKNGKYMTQKEARAKGYRPAHGNVCG